MCVCACVCVSSVIAGSNDPDGEEMPQRNDTNYFQPFSLMVHEAYKKIIFNFKKIFNNQ